MFIWGQAEGTIFVTLACQKMPMRKIFITIAAMALAAAPGAAQAIEGQWTNPKRTVVVEVARCGAAYCGTVVQATEKAKAKARKGGTANLVGTQILSGLKPIGDGRFRGRAFVPKRNAHATATVRQLGADAMQVQGCILGGLLCDNERWTRVTS
jgi:uncharacterized protein (DUF2147 family)